MSQRCFAVCGVVFIDEKVLLVRHTYGRAKGRILLPGGYVKEKELPTDAIAREIFEETSVISKAETLFCVQFKLEQWCAVFQMQYLSGIPQSDCHENNEVLLLPLKEALDRPDITNMSHAILTSIYNGTYTKLKQGTYCPDYLQPEEHRIFGV